MKIDRPFIALCGAGCASGALLGLAFASAPTGWLAWIALVPLLVALPRASAAQGAVAGFACGTVAAYATFGWLLVVPAFGAAQLVVLGIYMALYPALWGTGVVVAARARVPLVVSAPALWVALEAVRLHAGFLALPWATLAQAQHANLALLQAAAWGGEASVTFLVVMGNVAIAALIASRGRPAGSRDTPVIRRGWLDTSARRSVLAATAAIAAAHVGGALVLAEADTANSLIVAAVQPSIGLRERETTEGREAIWQRLERLTLQAARSDPAVVVWPETAIGDPARDLRLAARLSALAATTRAALIVGSAETEKFASAGTAGTAIGERGAYNSAYLVVGDQPLGTPYRKRKLVPFGEYLPGRDVVPWPRWLVPDVDDGKAGTAGAEFDVPGRREAAKDSVRIGVLICWENLFADLSRTAVRDGAVVLVQLTNDVWFGNTRASGQHNAASVLRAVENRVPIVLASNSGPSQVIDAHGRVSARAGGLFEQGVAVARVDISAAGTLFTRTGDLVSIAAIALTALALADARWRRRRDTLHVGFHRPNLAALVKETT